MMQDLFIPINEIDVFWRTLDIPNVTTEEVDEEVTCDAEIEKFKKKFADQPKAGKFSLLRTLKGIFEPSTKLVEPAVHKNTRGRPSLKSSKDKHVLLDQIPQEKESRRHSCSMYRPEVQFELNEPPRHSEYVYRDLPTMHSSKGKQVQLPFDLNDEPSEDNDYVYEEPASMVNDFFEHDPFMQNLINYQPPQMQEPENSWQYGYNYPEPSRHEEFYYEQPPIQEPIRYRHPLIHEIPSFFQPYVIGIEDVLGDGNCGFRAVAVAIGRHQNEWPIIRRELLEELHDNKKQYKTIYGEDYKRLEDSINFFGSSYAPTSHWMWMPNTGQLISNKYNCILYFLTSVGSLTYFPIRSNPQSPEQNRSITIALVHGNHFVKVDLKEGHPMPDVSALYKHSKKRENRKITSAWEEMYKDRLLAYKQAKRNFSDPDFIECG